jgi:hypothetical protein
MELNRNYFRHFVAASIFLICSIVSCQADCQGDFTPVVGTGSPFSQVHVFPKDGNQFMIAGAMQTIPSAVGVISGGVIGTYNDASVDKTLHQTLAPHTLYFAYLYMLADVMTLDFSQTGHKEDPTFGNEVHATDQARSLVGMVYTDEAGKFIGDNARQLVLSWCHPIRVPLFQYVAGAHTNSPTLVIPVGALAALEWLEWGVNNSFPEGMDVPNVMATITLVSDTSGAESWAAISIDGVTPATGDVTGNFHPVANKGVGVPVLATAAGTPEGHHTAQIMLTNAGSLGGTPTITITAGKLYTSPMRS